MLESFVPSHDTLSTHGRQNEDALNTWLAAISPHQFGSQSLVLSAFGSSARDDFSTQSGNFHLEDIAKTIRRCIHEVSVGRSVDLTDALEELNGVEQEAKEKQIPVPSSMAFRNTRQLLLAMHHEYPRIYSIYPVEDGEQSDIVIDATTESGNSLIVSCGSNGSVHILVCFGKRSQRAAYSHTDQSPDGFLLEALREFRDLEMKID